ncbi:Fur family transcriptional regulator [Carboxydothermus ferrireducens]|uniref:Fur family ferric uptake transcriptional regulator/Fur family peroxide stress response transcriptional regulator n=1 Tax=Carboxydothermus ferrireducens DSM 11255 TaxID=1119529 RepID=A0ABX2RB00_9THEO|nr:transcriptional repressor [Carboxydothermus ferrireducens]NYE57040.1 Fur family ferric uptake transcriptional regulator/Fur family peroxide stress response transcriptional regulator [Carboxydothermus ferrireducens DSM 11255]
MAATTRMTRQKKVIIDILKNTKNHPTADWIYEQARRIIPDISLGTVYRNLRQLTQSGEILELNYGSSYSRFDGNPVPHYHFVCENCGRVYDVDMPVLEKIEKEVEEKMGFSVKNHRLEFYGVCSDCQQKVRVD